MNGLRNLVRVRGPKVAMVGFPGSGWRIHGGTEHAMRVGGTGLAPGSSIGRTRQLPGEREGSIFEAKDPHWRELAVVVDSP